MTFSATNILKLSGAVFGIALAAVPMMADQPPARAPVPAGIVAAKRVFISNAGVNAISRDLFLFGDADRLYNQFYAAMKTWGRFDLVGAPSDAELVFAVRLTAQFAGLPNATVLDGQVGRRFWTPRLASHSGRSPSQWTSQS